LRIELDAGQTPAAVAVETAWVRNDHRIVAQGRTRVDLRAGESTTRRRLRWTPWPRGEGDYRLALALSPPAGETLIAPSDGRTALHYDRRLDAGVVRMLTPSRSELPALTRIGCRWET